MVVLETAAIGAAGYGVYRGGEAAVRKGKQTQKEFQFQQGQRQQKAELITKSKERSERIAKISSLWAGDTSAADAPTTTSLADRHKDIMTKLKDKPKATTKKKLFSNPFKRK